MNTSIENPTQETLPQGTYNDPDRFRVSRLTGVIISAMIILATMYGAPKGDGLSGYRDTLKKLKDSYVNDDNTTLVGIFNNLLLNQNETFSLDSISSADFTVEMDGKVYTLSFNEGVFKSQTDPAEVLQRMQAVVHGGAKGSVNAKVNGVQIRTKDGCHDTTETEVTVKNGSKHGDSRQVTVKGKLKPNERNSMDCPVPANLNTAMANEG